MAEQDLRKRFAIDYDTYLNVFKSDASLSTVKGSALIDHLNAVRNLTLFMPVAERF